MTGPIHPLLPLPVSVSRVEAVHTMDRCWQSLMSNPMYTG